MNIPHCPACQGTECRDLGSLPEMPPTFGGQPFPMHPPAGNLWRCRNCKLWFRSPYLTQRELTDLYRALPETVWEFESDRHTWKIVRQFCEAYAPGRKILDVGCFTGDFLSQMPHWERFGIEPSSAASKLASSRTIKIVGSSLEDVQTSERFDAITMLDVIEHFENPMALLSKAVSLLSPGGCIVILTGDAASPAAKLLGRNYSYLASTPEHVAVISENWLRWACSRLNLELKRFTRVRGVPFEARAWTRDLARSLLFALARRMREAGVDAAALRKVPGLSRAVQWRYCPTWLTAKDHLISVLRATDGAIR